MVILELLSHRPMHPYEATQVARRRPGNRKVKLSPGSIYHTVERLEAKGLIEVTGTHREGHRPERTVYRVTESGRAVFTAQARDMISTPAPDHLPAYPVALSAGPALGQDDFLEQLKTRVTNLRTQIAADDVIVAELREGRLPEVSWLDFAFAHHQRQSEANWTAKLIEDLETGRIRWPEGEDRDRRYQA
jgi:DNA-binding PadR family transcriptional regulator